MELLLCNAMQRRGEGVSCTYVATAVTGTWVVRYMYGIASTVYSSVRCKHRLFLICRWNKPYHYEDVNSRWEL